MFYRPLKVTIHAEVAYYERINFTLGDSGTLLAFDFKYKFNLPTLVGCNLDLTFKAPNGTVIVVPSIIRSDDEPTQIPIPEVVLQNPGSVFVEISIRAEGKKITIPTRLEYIVRDVMLDNPTTEPIYEILIDKAIDEVNKVINTGFEIISNAVEVAKVQMQYFLETELDGAIAEKFDGVVDINMKAINTAKDSSIELINTTSANANSTLQALADSIVEAASFFDSDYTTGIINEFKLDVDKIIADSTIIMNNTMTESIATINKASEGIIDSFNTEVDRCVATVNTSTADAINRMIVERDVAISKVNTTCQLAIDKAEATVIEMIKRADAECLRVTTTGNEQNALLLANAQKFNTQLSALRDTCISNINDTFTEKNNLLTANATAHLESMATALANALRDIANARGTALTDISNAANSNIGDMTTSLSDAILALNTRKDAIIVELNTLKDNIISLMNTAKDTHLSTLLSAKTAHITEMGEYHDNAIANIISQETTSTTNIVNRETLAIGNIATKETSSIKAVDDKEKSSIIKVGERETLAITNVGNKEDLSITNVQAQETSSLNTIKNQETESVALINTTKTDAISALNTKEQAAITNIGNKETSAITKVGERETLAITNVGNKETSSISNIATKETSSIKAVDDKEKSAIVKVGERETLAVTNINTKETSAIEAVETKKVQVVNTIDEEFFKRYETETTTAMINITNLKESSANEIVVTKNQAIEVLNTAVSGIVDILADIDQTVLEDRVAKLVVDVTAAINVGKADIESHMSTTYVPAKATLDQLLVTVGERNNLVLQNTEEAVANITNTKTTAEASVTKKVTDEVARLDTEVFNRYDESNTVQHATHQSVMTQINGAGTEAVADINTILTTLIGASEEMQANIEGFRAICKKIVDDEIARLNAHIATIPPK